jgi:WD40 repeat protein
LMVVAMPWMLTVSSNAGPTSGARAQPARPNAAAIALLIRQLGSENFRERQVASKALADVGEPALEALRLAAATNHDAEIRHRAEVLVRVIRESLIAASRPKLGATIKGGQDEQFSSLAFSPDGKTLASGGSDRTVRLWNVATGVVKSIFAGHTDRVTSVAFSPDGKILASGSIDRTVRLWDVANGKNTAIFCSHVVADAVFSIAFSPDGRMLAAGDSVTIKLWDVPSGKEKNTALMLASQAEHYDRVSSVAFSPDGKTLASGGTDPKVRLWDVATCVEKKALPTGADGPFDGVTSVAFSPDGKTVAAGGMVLTAKTLDHVNLVKFSDVATGKDKYILRGSSERATYVTFGPDGKTLLFAARVNDTIRLWDLGKGEVKTAFPAHTGGVWCAVFSPDGKMLASSGADHTIKLWDLTSTQPADH